MKFAEKTRGHRCSESQKRCSSSRDSARAVSESRSLAIRAFYHGCVSREHQSENVALEIELREIDLSRENRIQ